MSAVVDSSAECASGYARPDDEIIVTATHQGKAVKLRIKATGRKDGGLLLSVRQLYSDGSNRVIGRLTSGPPDSIDLTNLLSPPPIPLSRFK